LTSKAQFAAMSSLSMRQRQRVRVLRCGVLSDLDAEQVVTGDLVVLEPGDRL
jgi:magnesium-transporting ATPase (P-type)